MYKRILETKGIIDELEANIKKQERIKNSMLDTLVGEIRNISLPFSGRMLHAAFHEQNKKSKKERPMFEFVKAEMLDRFFVNIPNVRLKEITSGGYEGYAYRFRFVVDKKAVEISVPNKDVITRDNLYYARFGMYGVSHSENNAVWRTLAESYNEEEIRSAIREYLECD